MWCRGASRAGILQRCGKQIVGPVVAMQRAAGACRNTFTCSAFSGWLFRR